jgi:hypothetical protein
MKSFKDLKPFSKEWFENYWMYYKWHTIGVLFVLVIAVTSIIDVVNKVHPDINLSVVTEYGVPDEQKQFLKTSIESIISDINNDGKKVAEIQVLNASLNPKDEMQMAANQKLFLEFAAGEGFIFIMDKALYENYAKQDIFMPLKNNITFISANEIAFLDGTSFKNDKFVFAVRNKRQKEDEKFKTTDEIISKILGE